MRIIVSTSKGKFILKFQNVAPVTVTKFVSLVESEFYNGKTFHRLVPNFVIQGGDPRGDGFGGPGYMMRDEVSSLSLE